jgi:glycosyltransferase involved in cell wall biosynthesis
LRITYVLPFPELNGGNKVIFQHAALLAAGGHEVAILGEGERPQWWPLAQPWHDLQAGAPRLPAQDLVIATYWTTLPVAAALGCGPVAHFCQGYEGDLEHLAPYRGRIEELYGWRVPTLTVSPHLGELLRARFGLESRVAPPPLDPLFVPASRTAPAAAPWIAVPGIFQAPVKGVPSALETVRALRAMNIPARLLRLSILPLTAEESALLAPDRYLHQVAPAEVAAALRECDLLLLPSGPAEGFGLPLLEAMASGVPAVASRIPATEAMASEAVHLVPVGDVPAFTAAAHALLVDAEAWRDARSRGLAAAARFDPRLVGEQLDASVRWAAERAAAAPLTVSPAAPYSAGLTEISAMQLNTDPAALRPRYTTAQPFPHIAIDGLFDPELLHGVLADFPRPGDIPWRHFESATEKKLGWEHTAPLRPRLREFVTAMNAPPILEFLEQLTGIDGLIPDPYYGGAGPHQIEPGGFLKIHADFNWHPKLKLDRRLNMLVYLNEDWHEEYGGHLELWDREMTRCVESILPLFNRTVVFSTTDFSYHGHPRPLACPPGRTRKSVSFYYYTNGRPDEERSAPHDTIFRKTHDHEW